jgi:hypothetical protein
MKHDKPTTRWQPIIVVAAGRSGSKLLRGILASHPEAVCFPREINYIWRHGNLDYPTDELRPEHARPEVVQYVRKRFDNIRSNSGNLWVVEKTCANSLRVDFVHAIFPEAYFVHLVRDGRAVAESARRRWQARPELSYLLEKLRWVPRGDIPFYALRYLRYQWGRWNRTDRAQASWGPRFSGLDRLVAGKPLIEVCGLQWQACVRGASTALEQLPERQTITVRYEDLVNDPVGISEKVFDAVGLSFGSESQTYVEENVRQDFANTWQARLAEEDLGLLLPHLESDLRYFGYEI